MSNTDSTTETTPVTFEKGSWQDSLNKSATLLDRSTKARKQASNLLWSGAVTGIEEWLPESSTDVSGESFYNTVLSILGTSRKGDASKIKTVAVAVRNNGLVLSSFPNLSKAYAEATRLTKTIKAQAEEDDAADKAVESITAPKTAGTPESAALLLLSKGIDGAVVAILDSLGKDNEAAHRAFMRAIATEVAARVQAKKPKPAPKAPAKPKTVKKATASATKAKPAPKSGATKAKPTTKAKPVKAASVEETVESAVEGVEQAVAAKPVRRAVPVRRPAKA